MQSRQTLLFYEKQPWVKKTGTENFDVPMGCYDGAEVCELVGCYILNQLRTVMRSELVGLYRDDRLGYMKKMSGPEIERKRKQIIKIFKDCGLSITIKTNLTSVDFLDIRLNLKDNTYQAYRKPNSERIYIRKTSNHPKNAIKDLPKAIGKRLSDISCNQEVFEAALPIYEEALRKSGINEKLSYTENNSNNPHKKDEKRRRKRNIIWFNPPYSANMKTNNGKVFFRTLKKNFPRNHLFYKVFNKSTIKLSCMTNIAAIISSHNKHVLKPKIESYGCNCRDRDSCPMQNQCLTPQIVDRAYVSNNKDNETKFYYVLTETSF